MLLHEGENPVNFLFSTKKSSLIIVKGALNDVGSRNVVLIINPAPVTTALCGSKRNHRVVLNVAKSFSSSYESKSFRSLSSSSSCSSLMTPPVSTLRIDLPHRLFNSVETQVQCVIAASQYLLKGNINCDKWSCEHPHVHDVKINDDLSPGKDDAERGCKVRGKRPRRILLIGYSHGGLIAGMASAIIPECIGVVHITCPLSFPNSIFAFRGTRYHYFKNHTGYRSHDDIPKLIIHGENDSITSIRSLSWCIKRYFSSPNHREKNNITIKVLGEYSSLFTVKGRMSIVVFCIHEWLAEMELLVSTDEN